jgi:hypothetical protein
MAVYKFKFKRQTPPYCCPYCAEPVGYLGRFFGFIFGLAFHGCTFSNVVHPPGWEDSKQKPSLSSSKGGEA